MSLPPGLVSDLQSVLLSRKDPPPDTVVESPSSSSSPAAAAAGTGGEEETSTSEAGSSPQGKPILLVTNCDGIDSPGLASLVEALVGRGLWDVYVCAPQS
ncbi:hypothetical protein MLD38_030247 [Melastoma candidum]|nr:hypothetical protein MLD38_030247 [Melastoma candidum]